MSSAPARAGGTAILLATAANERGGAAATLPYRGTLLGHMVGQLGELGVDEVVIVTRPQWHEDCARAVVQALVPVSVADSPDLPGDCALVAGLAAGRAERLLVAAADLAVSREALAGMVADPRVATGALVIDAAPLDGAPLPEWAARARLARGRIVSAGSAFHVARRPNAALAGVAVIAPRATDDLANVAAELAILATPPWPPSWQDRWIATQDRYRHPDLVALLLVGLVRANVHVSSVDVREFFLARPFTVVAAQAAERDSAAVDEDRVLLDAAVKSSDGAFTTFLVSPYSRHLARWAARRGWTPNGVTTLSMGIGLLAAGAFATGTRPGLVAGAVLLQGAFTADCVDGQLARYTRSFSSLGAWLDSVFDRSKEYAAYAGLAAGSVRGFGDDVWLLAAAALALQTVRHTVDFSYAGAQHLVIGNSAYPPLSQALDSVVAVDGDTDTDTDTGDAPGTPPAGSARAGRSAIRVSQALERREWLRYGKKILVLPIGERFALISATAALSSPRTTFRALLAWGTVAAGYSLTGKALRSVAQ